MKNVEQIKINKGMSVNDLIKEYGKAGVIGAGRVSKAVDILELMVKDKECKVFMGLAGAMVPCGMREIIIDLIENGYIDVLVTTGANLTHDLVEALGFNHFIGQHDADDAELNKKGLVRIYDSYMPNKAYEKMEDFCNKVLKTVKDGANIREFLRELGKNVEKRSILKACYENNIPLFCPALADSGIGLQIWGFLNSNKLVIDGFSDLKEIIDISWTAKKTGVFYVGGGVPKNYIQQAMQFSKCANYGVQVTIDMPEFGGSSGAELREGISWGKMDPNGKFTEVYCDATIALPLIYAGLKERL